MKFPFNKALFKNKYFLMLSVFVGFVVWMTFFDNNNFISKYKSYNQMKDLENEIKKVEEQTKKNKTKLDSLQNNKEELERYARENYMMKTADEDIYVVEE